MILMNGGVVAYYSGRQSTVALCTAMAETIALAILQECVQKSIIRIVYIKTCKNIADIMTKQSAGPQFAQHRDFTLGRIDVIAAVIAAVAEIRRKIRIRV